MGGAEATAMQSPSSKPLSVHSPASAYSVRKPVVDNLPDWYNYGVREDDAIGGSMIVSMSHKTETKVIKGATH